MLSEFSIPILLIPETLTDLVNTIKQGKLGDQGGKINEFDSFS